MFNILRLRIHVSICTGWCRSPVLLSFIDNAENWTNHEILKTYIGNYLINCLVLQDTSNQSYAWASVLIL